MMEENMEHAERCQRACCERCRRVYGLCSASETQVRDQTTRCQAANSHIAFPASSSLVIRSVESEHMRGKNGKGIGMMSVELRGRHMHVLVAMQSKALECVCKFCVAY